MSLNPATATVGYLPQEPERRAGESVLAFIERRTGVVGAAAELDAATAALEAGEAGADDAYAAAFDRWMNLGGADLEERTAKVAASLGLAVRLEAPMTSLSGGQAARANLASLLLSRYDIFLLDEPTNDLDIDGLAILEDFVVKLRAGTVLVSHDRAFLERTVDQVLELDLAQQSVHLYSGGYLAYLEERAIAQQHARDAYEKYADQKAALADRMRMQSSWADKGVRQARAKAPDKDKHRLSAQVNRTEKLASKIKITERMLDRLEVVDEPRKEWELRMTIAAAPRSGTVAAALRDAVVSFDGFTLGPVNLQVNWADRVAITGPNGAGKSTLIGALLGRVPLSSGSASLGSGISVGEVDQARSLFDGPVPLLEAFAAQVPGQVPGGDPDAAGQVRPESGPCAPSSLVAVARGADPGRARAAAGARGQPARARRADQPPRPARHRAAGVGAGRVPRDVPSGDARPQDAGVGVCHTPIRGLGRPGRRG